MQTGTKAPRRRHADELKARVLADCAEPGASVAAVAQAHGLNANLVHKWRRGRGALTHSATRPRRSAVTTGAEFIALALPATVGQPMTSPVADIRIEWRRGGPGCLYAAALSRVNRSAKEIPMAESTKVKWMTATSVTICMLSKLRSPLK